MAWDALYEAQPTDATYVADTDDAIRSLKTDIRTRVAVEHGFNLSESSPQAGHGKHLRGSARIFVQSTDPTATAVTPDDGDYATGRIWLDPDDGRLRVYRGGVWNYFIAVAYANDAENSYACSGNAATATTAANANNLGGVAAASYAQNYLGTSSSETNYPVGTVLLGRNISSIIPPALNGTFSALYTNGYFATEQVVAYTLTGTWRCRGYERVRYSDDTTYVFVFLAQRVS